MFLVQTILGQYWDNIGTIMEKLIYKDEDSEISTLYNKNGILLSQTGFIDGKEYRYDIITGKDGLKALKNFFKDIKIEEDLIQEEQK